MSVAISHFRAGNGYEFGTITFIWDSPTPKSGLKPYEYGAPGEIRTPDLMVRSHALYPTELRARAGKAADSIMRKASL